MTCFAWCTHILEIEKGKTEREKEICLEGNREMLPNIKGRDIFQSAPGIVCALIQNHLKATWQYSVIGNLKFKCFPEHHRQITIEMILAKQTMT